MLAKVMTCAVLGLEGVLVQVEVDISPSGLGSFVMVGLPDAAVQEAKERVRTAVKNSGAHFPATKRVTVNLAPADLKKAGPSYDLPIAVGILLASEQVLADVKETLFLGELSLDGSVCHTSGILPMVIVARERGIKRVYLPSADSTEAGLVEGIEIIPVESLNALINHLNGHLSLNPYVPGDKVEDEGEENEETKLDLAYVKGQEHVKRALEIAAAGAHNCLLSGPPGSGKTLLARTALTILPRLTNKEMLEVTKIYSVKGLLSPYKPLVRRRPFRSPHHTISYAGLIGGGRFPVPGEISLAHRGVLFLDELPEFGPTLLEQLRMPLEDKVVTVSRASASLTFPANFILIAAMNPCPCGYWSDNSRACLCAPAAVARYQKRLSGPLLDRIDIHVDVPRIDYEKLADTRRSESSADVRGRVEQARQKQRDRFQGTSLLTNSEMGAGQINDYCPTDAAGQALLRAATRQLHLSARAYHRTLKLARTIADLAGEQNILPQHIAEAIQYRPRERAG